MLNSITPFRQLSQFYDKLVSAARDLSIRQDALTQQVSRLADNIDVLRDCLACELKANNTRSNGIIGPSTQPRDMRPLSSLSDAHSGSFSIGLYERLGLKLLLDRSSLVDSSVIDNGNWESTQVDYFINLMRKFISNDVIFLDLGSYWGLCSLLACQAGIRRIHAFDADRYNYSQLQAQIFLNNSTSAIASHNIAVGEGKGTVAFWDSRTHPDGNRAGVGVVRGNTTLKTVDMPSVSIDEFFCFSDCTIFIKLDVEGYEDKALQGMARTFQQNRVVMQIEIFEENEARVMEVVNSLDVRQIYSIPPDFYFANFESSFF